MINQTEGTSNLARNLQGLRKTHRYSLEQLAERIGVTRQAVAKWESGESSPDIANCTALAALYGVTLDDLVRYDEQAAGMPIPPKGKHIFGTVQVGERGQIVIPKRAREVFGLKHGDMLVVLGDTNTGVEGIALMRAEVFTRMTAQTLTGIMGKDMERE